MDSRETTHAGTLVGLRTCLLALMLAAAMAIAWCVALPNMAFAADGVLSGEGTEASPYLVEDAKDLVAVATNVNGSDSSWRSAHYRQTAGIDMADAEGFAPIGKDSSHRFTGVYDGDGNEIANLSYATADSTAGLFGYAGYGSSSAAGGNRTTIKGIVLSGTIASTSTGYSVYVGGVVARADYNLTISQCLNRASVTNANKPYCGGILGYSLSGVGLVVDSCGNEGAVSGSYTSSWSTSPAQAATGGIVGFAGYGSSITNCYNKGAVSTTGYGYGVGGIVGQWSNSTSSTCTTKVENCYNTGTITVSEAILGMSGYGNHGAIVGYIGYASTSYTPRPENNIISNCYWLDSSSDQGVPPDTGGYTNLTLGVTQKTDAEMKAAGLVTSLNGASGDAWIRGLDYPSLSWQLIPGAPLLDSDISAKLVEYNQNATAVALAPKFSLPASGMIGSNGTVSYQWYKTATGNVEDGVAIEDQTASTFTPPTDVVGEFYYYCVATNTWTGDGSDMSPKSTTSSAAHVYVHSATAAAAPVIRTQPVSVAGIGQDGNAPLSVKATVSGDGAGVLSYQWYVADDARKTNAVPVEGATSDELKADTTAIGTKYYYCVVTNTFELTKTATAESDVVSVEVVAAKISTTTDLKSLADRVNAGDNCSGRVFLLDADIDLSSDPATASWIPIGNGASGDNCMFSGVFDGQGHTISGLNVNSTTEGSALFGGAGYGASISNLTVCGKVSGYKSVAGLAGSVYGSLDISNVGCNVDVTASGLGAGGLVGVSMGTGTLTIDGCWAKGTVTSTANIYRGETGGFAGGIETNANISNSYSTAAVTSISDYTGSFFGYSSQYGAAKVNISNCYAAGKVNVPVNASNVGAFGGCGGTSVLTVVNSYCDLGVNGDFDPIAEMSNHGVTGLSSLEMKDPTFPAQLSGAGAFVVDAAHINSGYPVMAWEKVFGTPEIAAHPEGKTIVRNEEYLLSVDASVPAETADGSLTYQWYSSKTGEADVENSSLLEGETASSYRVPTGSTDTGVTYYFCVVTNSYGEGQSSVAVSSPAKMLVLSAIDAAVPQIVSLTGDATYAPGDKADSIRIQATLPEVGAGQLTYQWYKSDARVNEVDQATLIEGATSSEYVPATELSGTEYYFCVVVNTFEDVKAASAASLPVAINVGARPISTPEDLVELSNDVYAGNKYAGVAFEMTNDIDMTDVVFTPIGTSSSKCFSGTFDGNGYKITGLSTTSQSSYVGLFGYIDNASVSNVEVEANIDRPASSTYLGAVAGYASSSALFNIRASGSVTGGRYIAGVVGYTANSTITDAVNSASVKSTGTSSYGYAGGITGYTSGNSAYIARCVNTGDVLSVNGSYVGGIVAYGSASIDQCKNSGNITCERKVTSASYYAGVGGIMGYWTSPNSGRIENCYNTGNISATASAGAAGILGVWSNSTRGVDVAIENCYSTGTVAINPSVASQSTEHGTVVGHFDKTDAAALAAIMVSSCFGLEPTTIDETAYGHDTMVPEAATNVMGGCAFVTQAQLDGTEDVTVGESTASVLSLLNGSKEFAPFEADSTESPSNHGFPVLKIEGLLAPAATQPVTVNIVPAKADLAIVNTDGHRYTSFSLDEDGKRIYALPEGGYSWSATAYGYLDAAGSFNVGAEGNEVEISMIKAPVFDAGITVTTADGSDFVGTVELYGPEGQIELDNSFHASVAPGEYTYIVRSTGYITCMDTFTVLDSDENISVTIEKETVWSGNTTEPSDVTYNEGGKYYIVKVYTPSELAWVAQKVNTDNASYGNAHILLMNDMALNAAGSTENVWAPMGNMSNPFCGVFDGNRHTISGLYTVNNGVSSMYSSFFGVVGQDALIEPVTIKNLQLEGQVNAYFFGAGFVGLAASGSYELLIENCASMVDVNATSTSSAGAGGILGYVMATAEGETSAVVSIKGCYNAGDIVLNCSANSALPSFGGGIVGKDHIGDSASPLATLRDCYNVGSITLNDNSVNKCEAGGIIGSSTAAIAISGSYNAGSITVPEGSYSGAIAGSLTSEYASAAATSLWIEGTAPAGIGVVGTSEGGNALEGIDQSKMVASASGITAAALGSAYKDPVSAAVNNGMAILTWQSEPTLIDGLAINVEDVAWTGEAVAPVITVSDGDKNLAPEIDYIVSYKNAAGDAVEAGSIVDPGSYTATIEGIGSYTGSVEKPFAVYKQLTADMVSVADARYTGEALEPEVTAADGETQLVSGEDFTVVGYSDNIAIGTGHATVAGAGIYRGTVEAPFQILSEYTIGDLSGSMAEASVFLSSAIVSVDGSDVYTDQLWTTEEKFSALAAAIVTAQEVIDDPDATQQQIQGAGDALEAAQSAYVDSLNNGTLARPMVSSWTRIGGDNRYSTAAKAVAAGFDSADVAVMASGENAADALAASGLASILDAPVMLTASIYLPQETEAELEALGVSQVYVMGGTGAVSDDVVARIEAAGITVERVFGNSRTETACKIYEKGLEHGEWSGTAVVANGWRTADALSASTYSYAMGVPIFMTQADGSIDEATLAAIADGGFSRVVIVGGTGVVSESAQAALADAIGGEGSVLRFGGSSRYETSALMAKFELGEGMTLSYVGIATGADSGFADALGAAALCGGSNSVLVLAEDDGTGDYESGRYAVDEVIDGHSNEIAKGFLFGGTSCFSSSFYESLYNLQ